MNSAFYTFPSLALKKGAKNPTVRLETIFCKLPMTKIKLTFKEMRQKCLKKVISPYVSKTPRIHKSQTTVIDLQSVFLVKKNIIYIYFN